MQLPAAPGCRTQQRHPSKIKISVAICLLTTGNTDGLNNNQQNQNLFNKFLKQY